VIASTDTEDLNQIVTPISGDLWKSTPADNNVLMTAEVRFEKNSDVKLLNASSLRGRLCQRRGWLTCIAGMLI
jgi:hexosaminidase